MVTVVHLGVRDSVLLVFLACKERGMAFGALEVCANCRAYRYIPLLETCVPDV